MKQFETEHYIFHYGADSSAERDIADIAAYQESCHSHICKVLKVNPDFKIRYFLCETPEEVGRIYGDNEPCNGFTVAPDTIYAVYNQKTKCIGFHEDAHIISYSIYRPDCPAIRDGLAMFFDRKWWGLHNLDWTGYYLENGRSISIAALLDITAFFAEDCSFTYPVMGAFTEWLISSFGIDRYMEMYQHDDIPGAMEAIYGQTPSELNSGFLEYVRLFDPDPAVKKRIQELLQ